MVFYIIKNIYIIIIMGYYYNGLYMLELPSISLCDFMILASVTSFSFNSLKKPSTKLFLILRLLSPSPATLQAVVVSSFQGSQFGHMHAPRDVSLLSSSKCSLVFHVASVPAPSVSLLLEMELNNLLLHALLEQKLMDDGIDL